MFFCFVITYYIPDQKFPETRFRISFLQVDLLGSQGRHPSTHSSMTWISPAPSAHRPSTESLTWWDYFLYFYTTFFLLHNFLKNQDKVLVFADEATVLFSYFTNMEAIRVVNPYWFPCGSVSSTFIQCGSGSRSGSGSWYRVLMTIT
jgi:hypothetical protein